MQHCRERVWHCIKAALWLEPFDLALHQILQGGVPEDCFVSEKHFILS